MEFYIKLESGVYIAIKDEKSVPEGTKLYFKTADGIFLPYDPAMKIEQPSAPAAVVPDYIKELTGVIKGMADSISSIKQKEEVHFIGRPDSILLLYSVITSLKQILASSISPNCR